jgi:hypothetical protein
MMKVRLLVLVGIVAALGCGGSSFVAAGDGGLDGNLKPPPPPSVDGASTPDGGEGEGEGGMSEGGIPACLAFRNKCDSCFLMTPKEPCCVSDTNATCSNTNLCPGAVGSFECTYKADCPGTDSYCCIVHLDSQYTTQCSSVCSMLGVGGTEVCDRSSTTNTCHDTTQSCAPLPSSDFPSCLGMCQ